MSRTVSARRLVFAAGMCFFAAAPAQAQLIPTKPFRGIFRTTSDPAQSRTQIDFLTFLAGGYEQTTVSAGGGVIRNTGDSTFGYLMFRGRAAHQGRRFAFGADGGATTVYHDAEVNRSPFSFSGTAHAEGSVGRRGTFAVRQTIYVSPYFGYSPIETNSNGSDEPVENTPDASDPHIDERATRLTTKGYSTYASAAHQVGRTGLLFTSYNLGYTDYASSAPDVLFQSPRAGYRRRLWRFASFVASYGIQSTEYRDSGFSALVSQDVALGVAYDRPLAAHRRTAFGFSTGTSFLRKANGPGAYFNGTAHVTQRIGRTWLTSLSYRRGQQVLAGFTVPFFTFADSTSVYMSGRIFRELGLTARGSYTHGRYTIGEFKNSFDTLAASARLQAPIFHVLGMYLEGYYTDYEFQQRLGLIRGAPASLHRVGTRLGLTVLVPVLR